MTIHRKLDYVIVDMLESTARNVKAHPLFLGGISGPQGGSGSPPGGYVGWLPQTRVAYDETEAALSGFVNAGSPSLLDNLNHIRYRLRTLESGILIVDDWDANPVITNVTELTFSGALVTQVGPGHALVTFTGGGGGSGTALTVKDADDTPTVSNVDTIIFSGFLVEDLGSGDVRVTASGVFGDNEFYIDQSGGTSDTYGVLAGSVNGSNALFTVFAGRYISGSLAVYLNGQLQTQGTAEDWVETTPTSGTFTFNTAPLTGDLITVVYQVDRVATGNADTVDGQHASAFATSGHSHTMFDDNEGNPSAVGGFASDGNSSFASRRDHVHDGSMVLIYDQVLGGNTATINLGNGTLPTDYKHLMVEIIARTNRAAAGSEGIVIEFNDDTTNSNYAIYIEWHNFDSLNGDTSEASNRTFAFANAANSPTDEFAAYTAHIYDYNSTNKRKIIQSRGGQRTGTSAGNLFIYDSWGVWMNTAAITKIELTAANGNSFIAGSRFTLFGLR